MSDKAERSARPVAWLRQQRGAFEGRQTLDPLFVLGDFRPRNFLNGATYEPLYDQSALDAKDVEIDRLRAIVLEQAAKLLVGVDKAPTIAP